MWWAVLNKLRVLAPRAEQLLASQQEFCPSSRHTHKNMTATLIFDAHEVCSEVVVVVVVVVSKYSKAMEQQNFRSDCL